MIKKMLYTILLTVFLPVALLVGVVVSVWAAIKQKYFGYKIFIAPLEVVFSLYQEIWKAKPVAEVA